MTDAKEILKKTIDSAEAKLQSLESEQAHLSDAIDQARNEIKQLEKAIASFRDLEDQLPSSKQSS